MLKLNPELGSGGGIGGIGGSIAMPPSEGGAGICGMGGIGGGAPGGAIPDPLFDILVAPVSWSLSLLFKLPCVSTELGFIPGKGGLGLD
jgi:hypothetical protein